MAQTRYIPVPKGATAQDVVDAIFVRGTNLWSTLDKLESLVQAGGDTDGFEYVTVTFNDPEPFRAPEAVEIIK